MSILFVIVCSALLALALASGAYHGVLLARLIVIARAIPTVRDGLKVAAPAGGWGRVCVIIPAHNEERTISRLARSLAAQDHPALRIVFALDRCTDGTERVVRECTRGAGGEADARVEIVRVGECPHDWAGKTHAAWRGVRDSVGARDAEFLLFADADTEFDPELVRAAVGLLNERKIDLLSLLPELRAGHWFERVVQPSAGFELVRLYPLDKVNREKEPRRFANGQFMLFRRAVYDAIGGHERVKADLLEDMAFARLMRRTRKEVGARWGVFMSGGMLRCAMYPSWEAFRRGWKRIYTEAAGRKPSKLVKRAWRARAMGGVMTHAPAACLVAGIVIRGEARMLGTLLAAAGALSLCVTLAALARLYREQRLPLAWLAAYPIGAWMVGGIMLEAASDLRRGVKTKWGGREYVREVRA